MTTSRALEALDRLQNGWDYTRPKYSRNVDINTIRAALSAEEIEGGEIGPRNKCRETCVGCPALKTERWKDYLDNDDTDSGTKAVCTASGGTVISMYWNEDLPPEWCPAKAARQGRGG